MEVPSKSNLVSVLAFFTADDVSSRPLTQHIVDHFIIGVDDWWLESLFSRPRLFFIICFIGNFLLISVMLNDNIQIPFGQDN